MHTKLSAAAALVVAAAVATGAAMAGDTAALIGLERRA